MDNKSTFKNLIYLLSGFFRYIPEIFSKNFIKENYHKHMGIMFIFIILLLRFMDINMQVRDWGNFGMICLSWGIGWFIGFAWEWFWAKFKGAPFSYADILSTSYGSILGSILYLMIS